MNFKKYHVSRNLFDYSTITTGYRIQWATGNDYADATAVRSDYIPVNAGTYSCSDSVIVLGYDDSKNYLGATNGNGVFEKNAKNPISQFIIPTNSLCKYVKFLAFDSLVPMNIDAETMLNTGSTPLPYEPYSSEVWHDTPHYIHNTSTDTITTLPAVLYPNDTTATVGLKGNMEQNGTGTPSNPIQPSECGELETSDEKVGQYKIPILSGGVTTNIYLGSTSSTRQIKKYVITGNETIGSYDSTYTRISVDIPELTSIGLCSTPCLSSHYIGIYDGRPIEQVPNNSIYAGGAGEHSIIVKENDYTTRDAYKAYLQAQYAAGTPVTIWFAIPTPETATVNEPLRKIGDYADTVSGITIPTIAGANSFDVLTTLKPSEVDLTYHGWHDASVKEYDGSQWNE